MSKMIQVRNVSDDVHRTLKMRAAASGMSLSDNIKRDLEAAAANPTLAEIDARVRSRGRSALSRVDIIEALDDARRA